MFTSAKQVWNDALKRNSDALGFVANQILAMLQAYGGTQALKLPRAVHTSIVRLLRPAESALRRLIIIAARDLVAVPVPPRTLSTKSGYPASLQKLPGQAASRLSFQLVDPRKRFNAQHVTYTTLTPRVYVIAPHAPFAPVFSQPQTPPVRPPITSASERLISGHRLCLRVKAFTSALVDIPHHAKRLVRWRMRRETQQPQKSLSPLRPGKPPGHRTVAHHEIDEILAECHTFALGVLSQPKTDTS
jgi:hypothetical protein